MLRLKQASTFTTKIASSVVTSTFFLMLISTASAKAATFTFNTSDSQFTPGIDNQGWWSNYYYYNYDYNDNYLAGEFWDGVGIRNFFTFNLAALPQTETVVSAVLKLSRYNSPPIGTYNLFDVSTSAAILNNNSGMNASIYNDLGSGNSYGSFRIEQSLDSQNTFSFALNSTAISDINLAKGNFFSIGGSFPFISNGLHGWWLFSGSDYYGIQSLVVETVPTAVSPPVSTPEPTSALLTGLIGLGVMVLHRRKKIEAVVE